MIEESLLKSGVVGKDGFSWWIGRVAHSDYWKNLNLANAINRSSSQRVKVRIIGYHPWDDTLKEEDLPWAHVMMDAVTGSGQGSMGDTMNLVGGETCIGFFLDGDEAQQPVIIGLLHRSADVAYSITDSEVRSSGSSQFKPIPGFTDGKVGATKREAPKFEKIKIEENSPKKVTNTGTIKKPTVLDFVDEDGIVDNGAFTAAKKKYKSETSTHLTKGETTAGAKALEKDTTEEVTDPSMCGDGVISDISQALTDFIAFTNNLESALGKFVDPLTQKIVDIEAKIKNTAKMIASTIKAVINSIRTGIIKKILGMFKIFAVLNKKFNPLDFFLGPTAKKAFMKVLKIVYCLFGKIFGDISGFLENMLRNMISRILNGPFCAVEQFVSGILSKTFQFIEGALAPILNGINWLVGGIGKISDFLSQASSLAKKIFAWLSCTGIKCEKPSKWVSKINKKIMGKVDDWEKQIDNIKFLDGVEKDLQEFEKKVGSTKLMQWLNGENTEEAKGVEVNGVSILDLLNTVKKLSGGKVDPTNVLGSLDGALGTLSIFGNGHDALSACSDSIWNPKTQYDLIDIPIGFTHSTCIPPITEVNGIGFGAVTKPIVGDDGSIFSIEVIHGGSGYDHTTSVAVIDRSNFGTGAQAKAIVEDGSLKEVVLLYNGSGYCGGDNDGLPSTDPILIDTDTTGGGIGTSIVGIVTNFYVYTTGIGYTDGDTVGIGTTTVPIRTTPNGSIVEIDSAPVSGMGFSKRPRLTINSTTGFGAELIPVMKYNVQRTGDFTPADGVVPLVGITSVIDCPPEDHVFQS